ncbi:MAG: transcriptional repressor LexA, partial [Clostridia bacterium]|nr:transcriptional repressor LexA [Clostridia bacterium]
MHFQRRRRTAMDNLTAREERILEYMRDYVAKWGYPPTVRDIAGDLGIKSTSTVHKTIRELESKGLIKK